MEIQESNLFVIMDYWVHRQLNDGYGREESGIHVSSREKTNTKLHQTDRIIKVMWLLERRCLEKVNAVNGYEVYRYYYRFDVFIQEKVNQLFILNVHSISEWIAFFFLQNV